MVWELASHGAQPRVGRWASAWEWRLARGAVHGGVLLDITAGDGMGHRPGDGVDTAALRRRMSMGIGAIQPMPEPELPGQILGQGITVLAVAASITTRSQGIAESLLTRKTITPTPATTAAVRVLAGTTQQPETAMPVEAAASVMLIPATMRRVPVEWTTTRTPEWFTAARPALLAMLIPGSP